MPCSLVATATSQRCASSFCHPSVVTLTAAAATGIGAGTGAIAANITATNCIIALIALPVPHSHRSARRRTVRRAGTPTATRQRGPLLGISATPRPIAAPP